MERRRTAPRPALLLACAAVPAMALAGCSSGSGSDTAAKATKSAAPTTSAAPTVAPAKYAALPAACTAVARGTVTALVPKAKKSAGTPVKSDDDKTRGGCSWTGNGPDGYQYRWLSVTLERFDSSAGLGSAEEQAKKRFTAELTALGQAPGISAAPVTGLGDQATSVSRKATVSKITSQDDTVVVRTGNVVVIVEYSGAGLVGKKNPAASAVQSGAKRAAADAVTAVVAANG